MVIGVEGSWRSGAIAGGGGVEDVWREGSVILCLDVLLAGVSESLSLFELHSMGRLQVVGKGKSAESDAAASLGKARCWCGLASDPQLGHRHLHLR